MSTLRVMRHPDKVEIVAFDHTPGDGVEISMSADGAREMAQNLLTAADDLDAQKPFSSSETEINTQLLEAGQKCVDALDGRVHSSPALDALEDMKSALRKAGRPVKGESDG